MTTSVMELVVDECEKRAIVMALRAHPEWTLGDLFSHVETDGPRVAVLRQVTVQELLFGHGGIPTRLSIAQQSTGAAFDEIVERVLMEALEPVRASYLRARVGGPRWKLQHSLGRLVAAGRAERAGRTSNTHYWVGEGQ